MNSNHQRLCPSPEWAAHLQSEVLPRLCGEAELGSKLLELGPGPGASTDWLRSHVDSLVALEIDPDAADRLRSRFEGSNVEVVTGDATDLPWPDASFDSVASFTMLHHLPTRRDQDELFAEALRVLRPGGVLVASDSLASTGLHEFHADDTYNPVDPAGLIARLLAIGYGPMAIEVGSHWTVRAHKPAAEENV